MILRVYVFSCYQPVSLLFKYFDSSNNPTLFSLFAGQRAERDWRLSATALRDGPWDISEIHEIKQLDTSKASLFGCFQLGWQTSLTKRKDEKERTVMDLLDMPQIYIYIRVNHKNQLCRYEKSTNQPRRSGSTDIGIQIFIWIHWVYICFARIQVSLRNPGKVWELYNWSKSLKNLFSICTNIELLNTLVFSGGHPQRTQLIVRVPRFVLMTVKVILVKINHAF